MTNTTRFVTLSVIRLGLLFIIIAITTLIASYQSLYDYQQTCERVGTSQTNQWLECPLVKEQQ